MNKETDMILTISLDYRKTWDRSAAEIMRQLKTWDYETVRKLEAVVNDIHQKYWDRKNSGKEEGAPLAELER